MQPMLLALLQEAEEHGPSSPFDPEFGLIFWTWLVFIALFLVLKKYAWPAIVGATEEREHKIAHQLEEAARMNAESQAALDEHKRLLAGAKEDARALISEAKTVAEKERDGLLARTRQEQEQILERAKRELEAEREKAIAELRREAVDLSLAAASRLIDANLDDAANRKLVVEYLDSLEHSR
jgi:F-type H+-transporting ATPase subunit b